MERLDLELRKKQEETNELQTHLMILHKVNSQCMHSNIVHSPFPKYYTIYITVNYQQLI